jgi:RecA-family ATPase
MMPSLSLHQLAQALAGKVSGGQVLAPGPGHSANDDSLSVKLSDTAEDGFIVYSHSGDDVNVCRDHVRSKLGLSPWQPKKGRGNGNGRSDDDEIDTALAGTPTASTATTTSAAASAPASITAPRKLVCNYDYTDLDGKLVYQVQRWDPKTFTQRRPNGRGGWVTTKVFEGISRVPYRWPQLTAEMVAYPDAPIFCTEGEKDCDAVRALDLFATCVAGNVWTPEIAAVLKGRDIIFLEDNDKTGRDKAAKAGQALHGFVKSVRIAGFSELPEKGDVSDWIALDPVRHNAEALVSRCRTAPLFDPKAAISAPILEPLPFIDMSTWRVNEGVPPRQWGVLDLFPRRNVALLSGEGAAGKTLLQLQLGIAHALGRDWIGTLPEPGPFLYFGAEDDTDEIHRRLADILKHYGADFPDLQGKVHLLSFAGEDAVLGHADHTGLVKPTPLFERLMMAAIDIQPVLIGIDTSADVFAGNENDRSQVRQFVGMLRKVAIQANAYIIVNSHPSLTGINSGSGMSGSTGWHNSVRARAYLTAAKTDKDEEPDPNLRMLEFKKSNYGPIAKSIALRWQNGIYVPVAGIGSLDKMAKEQNADRLFVALLDRFNDQGRNVSEKAASKNYAPTVFGKETEAKKFGIKKIDFEAAMRRLFDASDIAVEHYGAPCRGTTRLVTR